jgi:hypothetical protein
MWVRDPVEILVGKETVLHAILNVADTAESITVTGAAPLIESTTAQASVNFSSHKILNLPRVSAGLDRLALLAPGISPTAGNIAENGAVFSANGQRPRSNGFLLDGQDNSHRIPGGPRILFNVIEAVSEYQVITNQFSAEYGLAQGSIVNVITRSGANQLHGMGNWLHRNDAHFTALTNLQRRSGLQSPPKFIENRYGATVGGPIQKDRVFFFLYTDNQTVRRDRRIEANPGQFTPTARGLITLVEAFPDSNTVAALLRHGPLTRPEGNPGFLPNLRADTLRSASGTPVSVETGRLFRSFKSPLDTLQTGGRIDLHVNDRNRLTGRYVHRELDDVNVLLPTALAGYVGHNSIPMRSAAVNWSMILSPTFINEARFGYDHDVNEIADASGAPYEQMGRNISEFGSPNGYIGFGLPSNIPQISRHHSVQIADNVSHNHGRHALKYGFQWNRLVADAGTRTFYNGQFQFDTLQNFADNRPLVFNGVDGPLFSKYTFADHAYYFQDDFRASPTLTLNLGIRYEVPSNFTRFASDITVPRERNPETAIWNATLPIEARTSPVASRDLNNWAPRLAFAWSPRGTSRVLGNQITVIRGGYGISYDFPYGLLASHVQQAAPLALRYSLTGSAAAVPREVTGDAVRRSMQPPRGRDPRQHTSAQFSSDLHSSMLHSWSLGFQRRLGEFQSIEVRYAGNRGIGLLQSRNANPNVQSYIDAGFPHVIPSGVRPGVNAACVPCTGRLNPDYAALTVLANTASSTYHGLQTRYEGRPLRQLNVGASYTWSRSLDNASDSDLRGGPLAQNPFDITRGERGPSAFDLPHVFTFHFVWDIPAFQSGRGVISRLLDGWSLAGIARSFSGPPATPQQRNADRMANDADFNNAFGLNPDTRRPFSSNAAAAVNTVGFMQPDGKLVDFYQRTRPLSPGDVRWIYNNNAAARLFGTPFGAGRNVLRGPGVHNTDLSLFKKVRISERIVLQLRLEAENAFNHPNLGVGATVADVAGFLNPTETAGAPRRLAMGVRLLF